LNPYQQFVGLEPSQAIEGEILEFDGSFDIPRIAAVSEWVIARGLLRQHKADQAIPYAEKATALDANSVDAHEVLSVAYAAQHENDAAEREYQIALNLYRAVDPAYQDLVDEPQDPLAKH
jgi:tetratricopeptide (TPR) repeat protein